MLVSHIIELGSNKLVEVHDTTFLFKLYYEKVTI